MAALAAAAHATHAAPTNGGRRSSSKWRGRIFWFAECARGGECSPSAVDDEIRLAFAAALWQFYGAQNPEGPEQREPVETADSRGTLHRVLDVRRWKTYAPSRKILSVLGQGILCGALCATFWGAATCERRWWQDYTDYAWAWKVPRWDARWAFAWCDTFSFSILHTGALWMAGWVTGPLGAAVAASVGTAFLQANGLFPIATGGTHGHSQWPNAMQQQQMQYLQACFAQ